MSSIDVGFEWPDWQAAANYGYTAHLTRRQWAWEFLRRNLAFRRDLAAVLQSAETVFLGEAVQVIQPTTDLLRWGILFRGFRARRCDRILEP